MTVRPDIGSSGGSSKESTNNHATERREPVKPVIRYRNQLLFRKSYQSSQVIRIRSAKLNFIFRPVRFGLKPKFKSYEC